MRWSIIGGVALAGVATACRPRQSLYLDPGKVARSDKPARDSQAAKPHKPATNIAAAEPRNRPGA